MNIQVHCPECEAKYKIPEDKLGKFAKCKKCQTRFKLLSNDNNKKPIISKKNKLTDFGTLLALFTSGFFRYFVWGLMALIKKPSNESRIVPQTLTFCAILLLTILPFVYVAFDFIWHPPANLKPIVFFAIISLVSIVLSIKYEIGNIFLLVLVFNFIQGLGLFRLSEKCEFSFLLIITIIIQAALVMPSLDTFSRLELEKLIEKTGQKKIFKWFAKLVEKLPKSLSQLYRDYLYLVSCALLYFTANIHSKIPYIDNKNLKWSFNNFLINPTNTAFFIFIVSLALILLRTNATDYISGWGRNTYSNMKENFNIILSLYTMIILSTLLIYRFVKLKTIYEINFTQIETILYSPFTADLIFIAVIIYYIIDMSFTFRSLPNYDIQLTEHCLVEKNIGKTLITFLFNNKSKDEVMCSIVKMKNLELESEKERMIECLPGITTLSFIYDKSNISDQSLKYGHIDLLVSQRKYKHRIFFSALHSQQKVNSNDIEPKDISRSKVLFDQYILIDKFVFNPQNSMVHVNTVGLFNTNTNNVKISVFNQKELKDKSIEVNFISDNKRKNIITLETNKHYSNILEIRFNYKKSSRAIQSHHVTASIILEIDGYETIKLPYVLEIEPKIYNDTTNIVTIEYPDSNDDVINPNEIVPVRGTNLPVRASFGNEKNIFFELKPGLTLLSKFDQNNEIVSNRGYCAEVSLVGLKRSGKTTFLTALALESAKDNSRITLIPNFSDKIISSTFNEYKERIINNQFPSETPEEQFDCFNFQVKFQKKDYILGINDIAGEYFGPEHLKIDEKFSAIASQYFEKSDFILITIDTSSKNIKNRDQENVNILRNIVRIIENIRGESIDKVRILFTKVDENSLTKNNIEEWLNNNMPQTYLYLFDFLGINKENFYYISIGKVQDGEIIEYNPTQLVDPIVDIIRYAW